MKQLDETQVMLKAIMEALQVQNAKIEAMQNTMADGFAAVRAEMADEFAAVRAEMADEFAAVRAEMAQGLSKVGVEIASKEELATVQADLAAVRSEMATKKDMRTITRRVVYLRVKMWQHDEDIHQLYLKRRLRYRGLL